MSTGEEQIFQRVIQGTISRVLARSAHIRQENGLFCLVSSFRLLISLDFFSLDSVPKCSLRSEQQ